MIKLFYLTIAICFLGCDVITRERGLDVCSKGPGFELIQERTFGQLKNYLHGSEIKIEGIFHYNFEDVTLRQIGNTENSIELDFSKDLSQIKEEQFDIINGKKVIIYGKLNFSRTPLTGLIYLDSVFCIEVLRSI